MLEPMRFAGPDDAEALVALRASMFAAMGQDVDGSAWRSGAVSWFRDRLATGEVLAVVADPPGAGPVASAVALIEHRAPSPTNVSGLAAHVSSVSTLAEHRRRGYARACVTALLERLDELGVRRIDLFATDDGAALYRDLGFRPAPHPALRRP